MALSTPGWSRDLGKSHNRDLACSTFGLINSDWAKRFQHSGSCSRRILWVQGQPGYWVRLYCNIYTTQNKQIQTVSPNSQVVMITPLSVLKWDNILTRMDSLCITYNLANACYMYSRKMFVQVYLWKLKGSFHSCVLYCIIFIRSRCAYRDRGWRAHGKLCLFRDPAECFKSKSKQTTRRITCRGDLFSLNNSRLVLVLALPLTEGSRVSSFSLWGN